MKSPDDSKQWIVDEPAAEIVSKIFDLCLADKGPSQIARQLETEKVLVPSAYYESINRKTRNTPPANPYSWCTGCAVNFKSTTVSYKVHKIIHNAVEDYQIIPNMQEPIISEDIWLRVQEFRFVA